MSTIQRLSASVAVSALAVTGPVLVPVAAHAPPAPKSPSVFAADWLAGQLDGGLLPGQFGGGDVGLSIDAALSLQAVGGQDAAVAAVSQAVQTSQQAKDYIAYEGFGYVGRAANATGKALAFLQSLDPAPAAIQGIDVQERMESLTLDSGASTGRIADQNTQDGEPAADFANSLGQAFAARGLSAAGSAEAPAALDYLLQQQCPGGGFRLTMAAADATSGLSCTAAGDADNDTTAIVLQQLIAIGGSDADVATAIAAGRTYLLGRQDAQGGWGGTGTEAAANGNSTGLAASVVRDADAQAAAAAWLGARQLTAAQVCAATPDQGALAYDSAALAAARDSGITSATRDQWQRVTAQSLPALSAQTLDTTGGVPTLRGRAGYLKAGTRANLVTERIAAGEVVCVAGPGSPEGVVTATGTRDVRQVTLPNRSGTWRYTTWTGDGDSATTTLQTLGRRSLSVARSKARIQRGGTVSIRVRNMVPGERIVVRYQGERIRVATANARGNYATTFRVGRTVGRHKVAAYGQFSDIRKGATFVRVLR